MIETAENLARDYDISREAADAYAMQSHQRAHAAWQEGRFADEVVTVAVPQKKGEATVFARDEGIRPDTSLASLGQMRALMKNGSVTAGNASSRTMPPPPAWWWPRTAAPLGMVPMGTLGSAGRQQAANPRTWGSGRCRGAQAVLAPEARLCRHGRLEPKKPLPARCWRC